MVMAVTTTRVFDSPKKVEGRAFARPSGLPTTFFAWVYAATLLTSVNFGRDG
jgi:hypothetical protein